MDLIVGKNEFRLSLLSNCLDLFSAYGVRKIEIVNLLILSSSIIVVFYLIFSVFLTPYALNKSRQLLSNDNLNSFLPTIRSNQFSDSFKGFTYIVEKRFNNEVENIFLHDQGNNLKNLSSNKNVGDVAIIAKKGIVQQRSMTLVDGQIISSKKDKRENEVIKFQQLNINLENFVTSTIKQPKLQETSTTQLIGCLLNFNQVMINCTNNSKKEILPILIRRIILPFYIPVITLICSMLLLKNKNFFSNRISIFLYSFTILLLTELVIRYTGLNLFLRVGYIIFPFLLTIFLYSLLIFKFNRETLTR